MSVTIFNHGGGGVSELSIKVVGGTVQPAGAVGLLWVNTAIALGKWSFAVAQPGSQAAGDVWVQTDAASANVINLLKTNTIKVNILRVKQYTGTSWVSVNAHYYNGTSWTQISKTFNPVTDITYTGTKIYADDGNGHWYFKFLTSGTLRFISLPPSAADIFLVGGGGGTAWYSGGGCGGYTTTALNVAIAAGVDYPIVIGAGGTGIQTGVNENQGTGGTGGTSSAIGYSASGGQGGTSNGTGSPTGRGGNGGSGGGGYNNGTGGSDGGNGGGPQSNPGYGQGTTTREFGVAGATLYSGGGGSLSGTGGAGGGANGGNHAAANTGGGAGGGGGAGCNGGSGIVVIRDHRA